jgi:site-specific DNA-cytosine methylase
MDFALEVLPDGGSGKRKVTAVGGHDGHSDQLGSYRKAKQQSVTGRNPGEIGVTGGHAGHPPTRSLEEMLRLQGLPEDWLKHQPWTMSAKRKGIGNGVAIPMGRQLARAIQSAMNREEQQ